MLFHPDLSKMFFNLKCIRLFSFLRQGMGLYGLKAPIAHVLYDSCQITRMLVILVFMCLSVSTVSAQSVVDRLWKEADNAMTAEDYGAATKALESIVMQTGMVDDIAIKSRIYLASIALMGNDLPRIYESLAYFNYLKQKGKADEMSLIAADELQLRYDSLLQADFNTELADGVYFSDSHNDQRDPTMLACIYTSGDKKYIRTLKGCSLMYNDTYNERGGLKMSANITLNQDSAYVAVWNGALRERLAQTDFAHSLIDEGREFKASVYQDIAKNNYSTSETIIGTIATEVIGGLFSLLGNAVAEGKTTCMFNEATMNYHDDHSLKVKFLNRKVSGATGAQTKITDDRKVFHLCKLYPHYEIFFYNKAAKSIVTAAGEVKEKTPDFQRFWYFHPAVFNARVREKLGLLEPGQSVKLKKIRELNNFMYCMYEYNHLFASMHTDTIAKLVPPMSDMTSLYDEKGYLALNYNPKDNNSKFDFCAVKNDAALLYTYIKTDTIPSVCHQSIYDYKGNYWTGQLLDGQQSGKVFMRSADGDTYDGNGIDFIKEGPGVLRFANGCIVDGTFNQGQLVDGSWSYNHNGIVYKREMQGGIWLDGKNLTPTEWVKEVTTPKPVVKKNVKKRKYAKKRRTRR